MSQALDERAREASAALRAAAELRPKVGPRPLPRTRPALRVALTAAVVVVAVSVSAVVAFRNPSTEPTRPSGDPRTRVMTELRAVVDEAPYHVFLPTAPGLTLERAVGEPGQDSNGHEIYTVDLWYSSSHGGFHLWMAQRDWATSTIGSDLSTVGRATTIAGTVWRAVTLPRPSATYLQLARATADGAIITIDGPFDLRTISAYAASLR